MFPVLGGGVVESQQGVAILDQAFDRLVVFDRPGFDEGVERRKRILFGLAAVCVLGMILSRRFRATAELCLNASR
jgi:hypothetical protein